MRSCILCRQHRSCGLEPSDSPKDQRLSASRPSLLRERAKAPYRYRIYQRRRPSQSPTPWYSSMPLSQLEPNGLSQNDYGAVSPSLSLFLSFSLIFSFSVFLSLSEDKAWTQSPATEQEDKAQPHSPATEFRGAAKRRTTGGQGLDTEPGGAKRSTRPGHRAQPQS